jgi:Tfp pilus assembly protein PilF
MGTTNIAIYEFLNRMLQASERGDLTDAEANLQHALELDPENMGTLRHAAGFYHIVRRDGDKARHYATLCRAQAAAVTAQMDDILGQRNQAAKLPSSRQIGGIIGPY